MQMNKEWTAYINEAVRNYKKPEYKIYMSYGSPMWVAYCKALREAKKQTVAYKLYKVKQAFRILIKVCAREWFKIRL